MIIWIASYPKSGNTWIRSLLSSYLYSSDGEFTFDLLENIKQFSSKNFSSELNNKKNYQSRISEDWIPSQKIINRDKKLHLLKTHNAMCSINGNKFTDPLNTSAVLYIVRDPRNLITSLTHHYELTLSESFNFLSNDRKIIFPNNPNTKKEDKNHNDFNFISSWNGHYNSWKNINFCPVKIIKYEDFLVNTEEIFISILEFLKKFYKFNIDSKKVKKALLTTSFDSLKSMEATKGFNESIISMKNKKKIRFFNLEKNNNWKKLLDSTMAKDIENKFKKTMTELNYL